MAAGVLLIWAGQRRLIYFPDADVPPAAAVGLPDVEALTVPSTDGVTLHAWLLRPPSDSAHTVLVFNGNAGNRAYRAPLAAALHRRGMGVVLFDYRGFGENGGTPTEQGLAADARALRAHVQGLPGVHRDRLVYFGESLGSAVATTLAVQHPPAALVLRSPFTSMVDVGRVHYPMLPVRRLLRDRFASIEAITRVKAPVLVIAGDRDGIVPVEQSRRLFDAARGPKRLVIVEGADHNDAALLVGAQLIDAVVEFVTANAGSR